MDTSFDVIVIGGGHAGCEAAAAAARMGASTALITQNLKKLGEMSCNPAIGGLGKGHLVAEIDALDGLMGRVADKAGIQFRILNASKGPAVRGPRAQTDKALYKKAMQAALREQENLTLIQGQVNDLIVSGKVDGVTLSNGVKLHASCVIITTGTFLNGLIHLGQETWPAGRFGDAPSIDLADTLKKLNFPMKRLKTGTPPRLDGRTIDYSKMREQPSDNPPRPFSALTDKITVRQINCHITWTGKNTHDIIHGAMDRAPLYTGQIDATGPRYCPSIEDKVVRFAHNERHQIFLEPEGLDDHAVYPNGISTSLPVDVQAAFVRSIAGLENVRILQWGYAIEYDYCDPRDLHATLESRRLKGLFMAGQINGTTGYEEAAAQGLIAGINAALQKNEPVSRETPFILDRTQAYIGVMIDDLITRGAPEPYRMFTSRAEYRLRLRADNADQRLTDLGIAVGCVGKDRGELWRNKSRELSYARALASDLNTTPSELKDLGFDVNQDGKKRNVSELLAFPNISWKDLSHLWPQLKNISKQVSEQIEIDAIYAGYMARQDADIAAWKRDESLILPANLNYKDVGSLSAEVVEILNRARPATLGAAGRIPGITPAAITALLRYVKKK